MKDPNRIARIEKAIAKKYGHETIENPRKYWNEEKEKSYQVFKEWFFRYCLTISNQDEQSTCAGESDIHSLLIRKKTDLAFKV